MARRRPLAPIWIALGIGGWLGLAWLVSRMYGSGGAKGAGFDLELILQAGRDLTAGRSPYRPDMLAGAAPESTTLFFSYPPHVAQVTSLVNGLSMPVVLTLLWIAAAAGIAVIAALLRARLAALPSGTDVVVRVLPAAATVGYDQLGADLDQALTRARRPADPARRGEARDESRS